MRRSQLLGAALAALALAPAAQAAPKAIEITSPAPGATVSRAAGPLAVTGTAAFDPAVAATKTFFLRGTGCGAETDLWLSSSKGTDDYDGCGTIGGLPLNEALGGPESLSARDGLPVTLDGSKPIAGVIRAESWTGDGTPGFGQVAVDVAIFGTTADDEFLTLGEGTVTAMNTGADGVAVPFSFPVPAEAAGKTLTGLTLDVLVRGANFNSSNLGMSGDSKFDLPILDAGVVQVSDSSTFPASRTVSTTLDAAGRWTARIPAPSAGQQTVYARAAQAGQRLSATPVPITVTP
jgi:hypothetical protein